MARKSTLGTVTIEAVNGALDEYDSLGADAFLAKHGFRPGRYMLRARGRQYHSKAVFGRAMRMSAKEFSGGQEHVQKAATRLGLKVVEK